MTLIKSSLHNLAVAAAVPVFDHLGLLHLHRDTVLFSQMKQMAGQAAGGRGHEGKRILIATLKGTWKTHLTCDYVLAAALSARGAQCSFLLCDGCFPKCDVKAHDNATRTRCWACHAHSRTFAKYSGMSSLWMGDFITATERDRLQRLAFETPYEDLGSIRHLGLEIDRIVGVSMCRFFRRGSVDGSAKSRRVHREFVMAGLLAATAISEMLSRRRPDIVIAFNGLFFAENILCRLCKERGIDHYTYEAGFTRGTLIFSHNAPIELDCTHAWNTVRDRDLTEEERRQVEEYVRAWEGGGTAVVNLRPNPVEEDHRVKREAGFREDRKQVTLFSNIVWDAAVHGQHTAFKDMFEWLRLTIEFFVKHPEVNLTIRVHPAEVKLPNLESMQKATEYIQSVFSRLPDNVTLIPPESNLSSYRLRDLSDVVITYASTIGLECAMSGKPTVVCGRTHYSRKGFTVDIDTEEQYYEALERLIAGDGSFEVDSEAAWKYAYAFFIMSMLPLPFLAERKPGVRDGVTFRSLDELAPGRSAALDLICDAILAGEPVLPRDVLNPVATGR